MRLPKTLRIAVEQLVSEVGYGNLKQASAQITAAYKSAEFTQPPLRSAAHRLAYAVVRMPATYAANIHALQQLRLSVPGLAPRSILDLGAGPGTSGWAVAGAFESLESYTVLERDPELVRLGKSLAIHSSSSALREAQWLSEDLATIESLPPADLVIISYALGELGQKKRSAVVERAWAAARQALVVIEPGTRRGFEVVLGARRQLIGMHAQLAAPCPHMQQCPMDVAGDWCHVAQRIERSSAHRQLKDGSLGYEDEKFSYVAASRLPVELPHARIVRHPQIFSGYVNLELCDGPVLSNTTVTRSQKANYKNARHADWGDGWNL